MFVGLFIVVTGLETAVLSPELIAGVGELHLEAVPVLSAVTALLSNLVSNVPAVMLLKSLIPGFANPHTAWLLLAMASTLSGNLTITGSVANIIVVERARSEVRITFRDYFRAGFPITVLTLLVGWAWLALIR